MSDNECTGIVHTHVHVVWVHAPRSFERAAPPQHRLRHAPEARKQAAAGASPAEGRWRWVRRQMHPPIPRHPLDSPEVAVVPAAESHPVEPPPCGGGGDVSGAEHVNATGRGAAKARWAAWIRRHQPKSGSDDRAEAGVTSSGRTPTQGFARVAPTVREVRRRTVRLQRVQRVLKQHRPRSVWHVLHAAAMCHARISAKTTRSRMLRCAA